MVSPITGPFNEVQMGYGPTQQNGYRPQVTWRYKHWYRQKRPYSIPLAFELDDRRSWFQFVQSNDLPANANRTIEYLQVPYWFDNSLVQTSYNKAYEKFISELKTPVLLATNYVERRQSLDMITGRVTQLLRFSKALRKGSLNQAMRALGMHPSQLTNNKKSSILRSLSKGFGNAWLEFHFGWDPLIKDIYGAVDVLQKDFKPSVVRGKNFSSQDWDYYGPASQGSAYWYHTRATESSAYLIQASVKVINPNLWTANQLGLLNPATVAWEAIPFSFVIDWFVNVGSFLDSFTDLVGLDVDQPFVTHKYVRGDLTNEYNWVRPNGKPGFWTYSGWYRTQRVYVLRRIGEIPKPSLAFKLPGRISTVRGATAISLLLQQLRK